MNNNDIKNSVMISNMISFDHIINNKISKVFRKYCNNMYGFLNYDENYLSLNDTQTGLYRSIIFSYPERKILSFCPSKSISYSYYRTLFPLMDSDNYVSQHIDGELIQLFYDSRQESWLLANKYDFGFYEKSKKKPIIQSFLKSLGYHEKDELNSLPFLKDLNKVCNYVFILSFDSYTKNPKLYLTNVFQVQCNLPNTIKFIPEFEYQSWPEINNIKELYFPKKQTFESYYDLDEYLRYLHKPHKIVLINNKTGLRCNIQNNENLFVIRAKEIDSFQKYLFFCLNRIHKDYKICDIYPHYARDMYAMKNIYEFMVDNIHQTYVDYFIQKKTIELNEPFKKYLIDIHKTYYIPTIKDIVPNLITRKIVKDYFNKLSPFELHKLFESI
uniref:Uncharacterized protein n=1 Tax=viral metagenome TaxID=1070528 RepID=A0A6C0FB25_9ZZZZ|tara:strand:- start:14304 stop:15461 length:1158 start_codon:yes stop_codon:yes gene_type:complete